MNTYASLMVSQVMESYLEEAAAHRATRAINADKPDLLKRIASAASSAKIVLTSPADYSKSIIPNLQDYPFRV